MRGFARAVRSLVGSLSDEDVRWRPEGGGWSVLEIVNHLADEESQDFRLRLTSTLDDPARPWPPIDPEGWVRERAYQERDLAESLERLVVAREETLAILAGLGDADWTRAYQHPRGGSLSAGDLLVSFAAHDALHLRQLAHRLYQLALRDGPGFSSAYAGDW